MITRFILHGGVLKVANESNLSFLKELNKDLKDGDKILFVGFARRDPQERIDVYNWQTALIKEHATADITVVNAAEDNFIEQVKVADVIFITGGETPELIADLRKYPDLKEAIQGKVVAGSSAGAAALVKYYFHCQTDKVLEGLGFVPAGLIYHADNFEKYGPLDHAKEALGAYVTDLELLPINETEWVVRDVLL